MPTANAREQSVCPVIIFFPCFNFCYQLTAGYQVRGIQLLNLVCTLCYLFLHTPPPSGCSVVRVVAPYLRSPDRVLHTACVTAGKSFFLGKWWHLYVHSTFGDMGSEPSQKHTAPDTLRSEGVLTSLLPTHLCCDLPEEAKSLCRSLEPLLTMVQMLEY